MNNNFADFDIYSKPISFFFNKKEKIGTFYGLILTILYILISASFISLNIFNTINRKNVKVYDSNKYSNDIPYININPKVFYFSFGMEDPKTSNRIIDEAIYTPNIFLIEKEKIEGQFSIKEKKELKYEICNYEYSEEYLFPNSELNNSYCIKDFNLTLKGGYNYDIMNLLRIELFPCANNTKNGSYCKSQEIIDYYMGKGIFSISLKDIGANPSDFINPVIPTIKTLYTNIDKSIYRDFIIFYGINEIQTDIGLLKEEIKTEQFLQFRNEYESFYFVDENDYYNGKSMISVDLRLDTVINIQKRTYAKLSEIFSSIGGYMQLINTIFTLVSLIINKIIPELKILNGIFNFNLKERKMTLKIHSIKELNSICFNKNLYFPSDKQITKIPNNNLISKYNLGENTDNRNISKNSLIGLDSNDINSSQINIINRKHNSLVIINENEKYNRFNNIIKSTLFNNQHKQNNNNYNSNNKYKIKNNAKNGSNNYIYRIGSFYPKRNVNNNCENKSSSNNIKEFNDEIDFNIFEYLLCRNIAKKKRKIELYKLGITLYKKRMDIINVFTLLLFSEKICLQYEDF